MLKIKGNIDIGTFHKVSLLMKQANVGYQPIMAMVFSHQDVNKFLTKADDETFFNEGVIMTVAIIVKFYLLTGVLY